MFCVNSGFVVSAKGLLSLFEAGEIPADTPTWIAFWIMKKYRNMSHFPHLGIVIDTSGTDATRLI